MTPGTARAKLCGMRWMVVAALLALAGCGGEARDALSGSAWVIDGGSCIEAASFDRSGGYTISFACDGGSGPAELSQEIGDYMISDDKLNTYPRQATCPAETANDSVTFSVSSTTLTIQTATSFLIFARSTGPSPGANGVATYGCFDSAGNFTPSPLVSI